MGHRAKVNRQGVADELGCGMLGFTDMQADRKIRLVWCNVLEQLVELLEWIRLQLVKIGIQFNEAVSGQDQIGRNAQLPEIEALIKPEL